MLCCRDCSSVNCLRGRLSQRRSRRLAMLVAVLLSTSNKVFSWPPLRLVSNSRLRRLAASKATPSSRFSTLILWICGRLPRWVSLAYCNKQPAAHMAIGRWLQPKALKSWVPSCWFNNRFAESKSNSQGGWVRLPTQFSSQSMLGKSSEIKISTGLSRCNSLCSSSTWWASSSWKRPLLISRVAIPNWLFEQWIAASKLSERSSSRASSLSVPGVNTLTTARSTGPLLVAGSPICSQIATDTPCFTSLAR